MNPTLPWRVRNRLGNSDNALVQPDYHLVKSDAIPVRIADSKPPRLERRFVLGHGLGNDYLVFMTSGGADSWEVSPGAVELVCDRWRGVGADGIVAVTATVPRIRLRMFNPDGTEFERSGNGLRIVAAALVGLGLVPEGEAFAAEVGGDLVSLRAGRIGSGDWDVEVGMGRARLGPEAVGLEDASGWDGSSELSLAGPGGRRLSITPVSVGNPHLVVFCEELSEEGLATIGPWLSTHSRLAHGANVQLAEVRDGRLKAMVWERGVGRTSASGTSACAVGVAAVVRGLLAPGLLEVEMPGGALTVGVTADLRVRLRAPVEMVASGELEREFVQRLGGRGG